MDFLTTPQFLVPAIGALKTVAICMFAINIGVILTWVERRLRGMIQDCIGPNRAGIPIPGKIATISLAAGPGLTAGAAVFGLTYLIDHFALFDSMGIERSTFGFVFIQGFIFVTWITFSAITRGVRKT